jgi:hypothetical protein
MDVYEDAEETAAASIEVSAAKHSTSRELSQLLPES